jgi:hypothetical protein
MFKVEEKVVYKAFGLSLISELPLPELSRMDLKVDSIDIEIKFGDLSEPWSEVSDKDYEFVFYENLVMFKIPNIATFSIQDGKFITVSPINDPDEDLIRLFILGTCMGAILMQRKIFPLHGSAVEIDGKAYAIVGDSGAGKSTLASAFLSQGYKLLSDDVIAVTLSQDEYIPYVTPAYPQQKLWQDSLNSFGMEAINYQSIYGRENKYCIPVPSNYYTEPLPLAGVIELVKTNKKEIEIRPIEKLERFHTLFYHTYRNFFIQKLGLMDWHFNISANLVNKVDVFQLQRPITGFNASQLVSIILNNIKKEKSND